MGYTHYWRTRPKYSPQTWKKFTGDFSRLLKEANLLYLLDKSGDQALKITNDLVFFNGKGENSHETFWLDRVVPKERLERAARFNEPFTRSDYTDEQNREYAEKQRKENEKHPIFNFCKTNHKPYDICVMTCLILAKFHFGDDIQVTSDGEEDFDWKEAKELCTTLGHSDLNLRFQVLDDDRI